MTVKVRVQDLNDNPPLFDKQRYFTNVPEDLPLGSSVLRVEAKDADANKNGKIAYSINRRQSDKDRTFAIDENTGLILLDRRLNFERKRVHEIVVVAKDGGEVPQETSAFITVRVSGDNKFVGETKSTETTSSQEIRLVPNPPSIFENTPAGFGFAQVILEKWESQRFNFEILPKNGAFILTKNSSGIFLTNTKVLDYEDKNIYSVKIKATDPLYPEQSIEKSIEILVKDANDHRPIFEIQEYYASLEESVEPGSSVLKVKASDKDHGENGRISYFLNYAGSKYSDWFKISESTGLITTQTFLDCEMESSPSVVIVAMDHGYPSPFSATATLTVSVSDVNDNQPLFDSSYYEASLPENQGPGECFLRVKATDLDCGANSIVKYSFKDDGDDDKNESFMIEPDSGKICLSKELDHETRDSYDFTIIAKDRGGLSTSTMVKVQVMDVNDNAPRFGPSEYFAKINRKFPEVDKSILQIHAQDDDSNESTSIEYSIISGNIENTFVLDKNLGVLKLAKNIPSNLNRFKLEVEATDNMGLRASQSGGGIATIEILVTDDSEDLSIKQMVYEFSLPEDISPYSGIGTVAPLENIELGSYTMKIYAMSTKVHYFSLDSKTGLLRTESRLDHESNPEVVLNIKIEKEGRYNFCQILIHIEDVNDNTPEFGSEIALATVPEDFKVGSIVYVARARDADEGINGEISYRLLNDEDESNFSLNLKSGELKLIEPLDYENRGTHEVLIEAIDNGNPPLKGHLNLKISVHDVNDNNPEFYDTLQELQISENHPVDTRIYAFKARDLDRGKNGHISYSISENDYVTILPNSGVLILKKPLDREANNEFDVVVSAKDHGTPSLSSELNFKLIVSDKNDNSPKFDNDFYEFSVLENLPSEAIIGTVSAYDHDDGPNGFILYHLKTPIDKFKINENTGLIVTSGTLDREEKEFYEILVEATDGGTPTRSSQTLVQINVTDVNDNSPSLIEPYGGIFYVKEGSLAGTKIGKLFAKDPDEGDNLIFTTEDTSLVQVSPNGDVRLIRGLDYTEEEYDITIKISDTGSPPRYLETDITIMVVNENDERQYGQKSLTQKMSVEEGVPIGTKIGSISSVGRKGARFIMEDMSPVITVDLKSGDIITIGNLDADEKSDYEYEIKIEEDDDLSVNLQIHVKNINDERPIFEQNPIVLEISENMAIGTVLTTVLARDRDLNEQINYELIEESPKRDAFNLDNSSGELTLLQELDYEQDKEFLVVVRAVDTGSRHTTELTIWVTIIDINDNYPIFLSSSNLQIYSDVPLSIPVMRLLAIDYDSGRFGDIAYSIISGNAAEIYDIDENLGDLKLKKVPKSTTYTLTIRARDGGGLHTDTTLTIDVKINNDSTPRFLRSITEVIVPEDTDPNTTILSLDLKQRSSSSESVLFSLIKGTSAFYIDEYSGRINTLVQLDRETQDTYALVVQVASVDTSIFSDTTVINVKISDVNDNPPVFGQSCRDLSFPENINSSSLNFIQAIIAHDKDEGENGQLTYTLENDYDGKFSINSMTGRLFAKSLDREEHEQYALEIIASDSGASPKFSRCSISLRVLDANDNPPVFSRSVYYVRVKEDSPIGTEVIKIFANDIDEDQNSQVRYSLSPSGGMNKNFAINTVTGSIFTTNLLDREEKSGSDDDAHYILNVFAADKGMENILFGTAEVKIYILDTNDNVPEFSIFPFRVNISTSPPIGSPLLKVLAFDPDLGSNGDVFFTLTNESSGIFELSPKEGILTIANDKDWTSGSIHNLDVIASDKGVPPKTSKGLIEISVNGGPQVTLSFQKSIYKVELHENPSSGRDVTQVQAVRSDGRKQRVIYTFHRGNKDEAFEINANNGLIRVRDPEKIDFEINKEFNLTVIGQGLGDERLNAYAVVVVQVKNMNDNAPKFPQKLYLAKVLEGHDKGAEVLKLEAIDSDDARTVLKYEIIDGNVDGAFMISPQTSGIIRTNTVLDREIREKYDLTISAKDDGSPSLSGTCRVTIFVIDVNDNQPHFPPMRPIVISKATPPGSLVSNIRANDIDMYPMLTYKLDVGSEYFSINSFNGQLYLLTTPDFIKHGDKFNISIIASDTKHIARANTEIVFKIDTKYCQRNSKFIQPVYEFFVPTNVTYPFPAGKVELIGTSSECDGVVFKIDEDSDQNTFSVGSNGEILVHHGNWKKSSLIVRALSDSKSVIIASTVVILHQKLTGNNELASSLVFEGLPSELELLRTSSTEPLYQVKINKPPVGLYFELFPVDSGYKIDSVNGNIYLVNTNVTSREKVRIAVRPIGEVSPFVEETLLMKFTDEQLIEEDGFFTTNETVVSLKEDIDIEQVNIQLCNYVKSQNGGTPYVRIISGNEHNIFTLVEESLSLILNKKLDYEYLDVHNVIIRMGSTKLSLCHVQVLVINVNDNAPEFPISNFVARLAENSPKGSSVLNPYVIDKDKNDSLTFWTDSKEFKVVSDSGKIFSNQKFDYELKDSYTFNYYVNDSVGHFSESKIYILIESVDEYPPIFADNAYFFSMSGLSNPGDVIGQVKATDQDSGPDGKIFYYFSTKNDYFGIDESRGVITVIKALDTDVFKGTRREKRSPRELKLMLKANSKRQNSLEASTVVSIKIEESLLPIAVVSSESSLSAWIQGVIVGIVLLLICLGIGLFIHIKRKKKNNSNLNKFGFSSSNNIINNMNGNRSVTSSADNLDMELSQTSGSAGVISRFPPQYSEIVLDYDHTSGSGKPSNPTMNPTRSEISEKSHRSASSGRGSVEEGDDEDVEIRMINEGSYLSPDGSLFLIDDDKLSQSSVQNSKDYFARLGIDIRKPPNLPQSQGAPSSVNPSGDNIHNFDRNSIYNRIPEDAISDKNSVVSGATKQSLIYGSNPRTGQPSLTGSLSSIVHSEEELAGSYNWDYLLDWGPQYQPLAHVFKEISRLKDSSGVSRVNEPPSGASNPIINKTFSPLQNTRLMLSRSARSPISHDTLSQSALSPNFHPALSPLATKSPSVSPLALPMSRRPPPPPSSNSVSESSKRRENITSVI
ncbi:protein dachsous [Lepeophtheirus salmonis]|uniref:protein dachsous n=1 Tax=Lepeophtheirus salmonis TaxID=72036 RepID=UPI001AEB8770|nr:protein dachsous-like [Lepeophtheirus salmonis]